MRYIRFAIKQINSTSHQAQGLFRAAGELEDSGRLDLQEIQELRDVLEWFGDNLPAPEVGYIRGRAVFWFRSKAHEAIQRMWILVNIMRRHDYFVEVQKCDYLYNIVYQDDFQVAAYPHRNDGKKITH